MENYDAHSSVNSSVQPIHPFHELPYQGMMTHLHIIEAYVA